MKTRYKFLRWVECSVCFNCFNYNSRRLLHPVHPCPRCGSKVTDGLATKEIKRQWLFLGIPFKTRYILKAADMKWWKEKMYGEEARMLEAFHKHYAEKP